MTVQVSCKEDLLNLREDNNEKIVLTDDIDFFDSSPPKHEGKIKIKDRTLDGCGFSIKNLKITNDVESLFMYNSGTIKNLHIEDIKFDSTVRQGQNCFGGLVNVNDGKISNCYVRGELICQSSRIGGIVGMNSGDIINCEFEGTMGATGRGQVGGIASTNSGGNIEKCHIKGEVYGGYMTGGIVGICSGIIKDCFVDGFTTVKYCSDICFGGIVGKNDGRIINSYYHGELGYTFSKNESDIGVLVGRNLNTIQNCFSTRQNLDKNLIGKNSGKTDNVGKKENIEKIKEEILLHKI